MKRSTGRSHDLGGADRHRAATEDTRVAPVETAVFRSGNSDAVRIPRRFDFPSGRVIVRKLASGALLIEPKHRRPWPPRFFESLPPLTRDFCAPPRDDSLAADDARLAALLEESEV